MNLATSDEYLNTIGHGTTYFQYWVWKNCSLDYYGFSKSNRFLSLKSTDDYCALNGYIQIPRINEDTLHELGYTDLNINETIKSGDVFVGTPIDIGIKGITNIYWQYKLNKQLDIECLDCTIQALCDLYPEHSASMRRYVDGTTCYQDNLFIMNHVVFNEYCSWLFDILREVSTRLANDRNLSKLKYNVE